MKDKINYRIWQFRQSFKPDLSQQDWDRIRLYLSPVEIFLFTKMPTPDQNHSMSVFSNMVEADERDEDLLKAALLHDIGKGLHRLRRWERVFAVLVLWLFPELALKWGKAEPVGLKRPLVIIHQHPEWGATMAVEAGCSADLVWLIRNHENYHLPSSTSQRKKELLHRLQTADNQN